MSLAASRMLDEQGQVHHIVITARDMTETNNLIDELRTAKTSSEAVNQSLRDAIRVNEKQNWLKTGETLLNKQMQRSQSIEAITIHIVIFLAEYIN